MCVVVVAVTCIDAFELAVSAPNAVNGKHCAACYVDPTPRAVEKRVEVACEKQECHAQIYYDHDDAEDVSHHGGSAGGGLIFCHNCSYTYMIYNNGDGTNVVKV